MSETSDFQDFDGNDMPVPIKGKPDLLALMPDHEKPDLVLNDVIIDYKLVGQF